MIEQAAPGQALFDRRIRVHANPQLLQLRRVERRDGVAPALAIGNHIGRAVVRLGAEHGLEAFGDPEDHIAGPRIERVLDETTLMRPPGVLDSRAEIRGDDVRDLVLEPREPLVRVRQVVGIAADTKSLRLRGDRCERDGVRHDESRGARFDGPGHVYSSAKTCRVPPTDVTLSRPDPKAAPTAPNAASGSSRDRLPATGRPNQPPMPE